MDHLEIIKEMRSGTYHPIYFLHGAEPYFLDSITQFAEDNLLSAAEKAFNQTILYGKDSKAIQVIDAARRFPIMAEKQLVILKEAQDMRDLSGLDKYVSNPSPTTVLIIVHKHKKLDMRTAFAKTLKSKAVIYEAKKLYDNQIPSFLKKLFQNKKLKIEENAAELMSEYLGTDLSRLNNEVEKIALNLEKGATVDTAIIEKEVGISRDYNLFELQKAIATRNLEKLYRIIQYYSANPKKNPPTMVIGFLYGFYSKLLLLHAMKGQDDKSLMRQLKLKTAFQLREYKQAARNCTFYHTRKAIHLLKEYDLASKGCGVNLNNLKDGDLLKEMLYRLVH